MNGDFVHRHIITDSNICHGRPNIEGHRLRVQDIVIWHERLGMSVDEICTDYNLALGQVFAALSYYFDYKEDIDGDIEADEAYFEAFKQNNPSRLRAKLKQLRLTNLLESGEN